MNTLIDLLNESETREDDENYKNPVDMLFEDLEKRNPEHFAVRQYKKYKLAAGKTAKSILISCGARLVVLPTPPFCEHKASTLQTLLTVSFIVFFLPQIF